MSALPPTDTEIEDMAHSALQEALAFGVGLDAFHRPLRTLAKKFRDAGQSVSSRAPSSELLAAATAVTEHWDSPLWKVTQHTGVFIHRLRAALAEFDVTPVDQTQPESAESVFVCRLKCVSRADCIAVQHGCASECANLPIQNAQSPVAQAQPESAPVRVPMTERELALAMVSVSDVLEFGRWPHHLMPIKDTLIEFAHAIELHHGIGSAT